MNRKSGWLAFVWGAGLAAAGAAVAFALAGGPWAVGGAMLGAVTGAFAPSVYDGLRERGARHDDWQGAVEKLVPVSPARLLDPRREVVGFVGRETELAELMAWCENNSGGRLRLVTGPGGVGKTRLAVELADRVRKAGWRAERITGGAETQAIPALRAVTRDRTLLIVDYAETRSGLGQMLSALASELGAGVRVLLLARADADWWDQLGVSDPAVWDLVQVARQATLSLQPAVDANLSDSDLVALAVRAFARELGLPAKTACSVPRTPPRRGPCPAGYRACPRR
jgi:Mrp family chromosome partitioning ATPase